MGFKILPSSGLFHIYLIENSFAGSAASSTKNIRCGVPQGSNLDPLLFLLYVNDLPNCLRHSSAEMYADDTNLTACSDDINNLQAILNSDLNNIHQWIVANKLTFECW